MSERRCRNLGETLIRRGVALRYARRAQIEIEAHHRDLEEEALARGASLEEARRGANAAIGTETPLLVCPVGPKAPDSLTTYPRRNSGTVIV